MIPQMKVQELKAKLDKKENFRLIDVREQNEYDTARIEGAELIPLSKFGSSALQILKPEEELVIHCHHGGRSQRACDFLKANGFKNVSNLAGGIDAWSLEVDSKVPRY